MTTDQLRQQLLDLALRSEQGFSERFEEDAARFYEETGFMAPGKSVPLEMGAEQDDTERSNAWQAWNGKERARYIALLRDAAAALVSGSPASSQGWQPGRQRIIRAIWNAKTALSEREIQELADAILALPSPPPESRP